MARNSADVTSELDHGTSSPSSSTAASDRSPKDTTKPTKNRSMARSKPLSRKSSAAAIPADSHIDVVSSEDEIADADADDVEDELAEEGDSEIVEVTAPATKKPGMAKPSALPRASASRGQPTSTKPPTPQEQPAPPQARKSALKPAAKPGPDDGAAAAPKPVLKAAAPQATREEKRLRGEIEDLRAENEQLDALIDKSNAIAKSFEEKYEALLRSREVGPDPNLQARNMELEKRVEAQIVQIAELRKIQEGAQHFISDDGIIQFTTKEAAQKEAQKERKGIEKELVRVKKANKELDEQVTALRAEKDALVAEKNTQQDEALAELEFTKRELKAEVERSKTLTSRQPGSRSVAGPVLSDANAVTLQLYEDLTNFLIINVKFENSPYLGLVEKTYHCVCSLPNGGKSLNFYLRVYHDPDPELPDEEKNNITSKDQLIEQCKFIPIELDKETDTAFLERLDFLRNPFTFAKDQIDVFAKTLQDRLADPVQTEESMLEDTSIAESELGEDGDDSVMEVEH